MSFTEEEILLLARKNRLLVQAFWPRKSSRVFESFCCMISSPSSPVSPLSPAPRRLSSSPIKAPSSPLPSPSQKSKPKTPAQAHTQALANSNLGLFKTLYFSSLPSFKSPKNSIRTNNTHTQNYVEGDPYTLSLSYVDFAKALRKLSASWREFYFDELIGIAMLVDTSRNGFVTYQDFSTFCVDYQNRLRKSVLNPKETIEHCFEDYVKHTIALNDNERDSIDFELERELVRKLSGMASIAQKFGISPLLKFSEIKNSPDENLTPHKIIELLQMVGQCEFPDVFFAEGFSETDERSGDNQSAFDDNASYDGVDIVDSSDSNKNNSNNNNNNISAWSVASSKSNINDSTLASIASITGTKAADVEMAEQKGKVEEPKPKGEDIGNNTTDDDKAGNAENKEVLGASTSSVDSSSSSKKKNKNKKNKNNANSTSTTTTSNSSIDDNEGTDAVINSVPTIAEESKVNSASSSEQSGSVAMAFPAIESNINAVETNSKSNINNDNSSHSSSLIYDDQDIDNNGANISSLPSNLSFSKKGSARKSGSSPRTPYHNVIDRPIDLSIFRSPRHKAKKINEKIPPKMSTEGDLRESVCPVRYRPAVLTGKYNNRFQTTQDLMIARRVNSIFFNSDL